MVADEPRRLRIGIDHEKVVVAPVPLTMRRGRARRRHDGSVTEVVPVPPSGRSRETRLRFVVQLAMVLAVLAAVLDAAGLDWRFGAGMSVLILAVVATEQAKAARVPVLAVPPGDHVHVLLESEERIAYEKALVVTRRIRRSWPELSPMIDAAEADAGLTRALEDLAAIMVRRQEIRRLRAELGDVVHRDLPADSPAVLALREQRARVEQLWRETGRTANRVLSSINAVALAGENLLREQRIAHTADRAELVIAQIAAAGDARSVEAGPELAERTAAVMSAYRELGSRELGAR